MFYAIQNAKKSGTIKSESHIELVTIYKHKEHGKNSNIIPTHLS